MKKSIIISIAVAFLFIFGKLEASHALTISPPSREMAGNPGEVVDGAINLFNETDADLEVVPMVMDFGAKDGEGGEPSFFEIKEDDLKQLSSWIEIGREPVQIKPGNWKIVPFKIIIPEAAEPGGHYASIFFGPQKENKDGKAVSINYQTGSLILLNVSGKTEQKGILKQFSVLGRGFSSQIPVTFQVRVENSGNVHFKPSGIIEVKNMFGGKTAELPVLKTNWGGNVLPHSIRKYDVVWGNDDENIQPDGFFERVKYQWSNFHFGRYSAQLTLALPMGERGEENIKFWIIPFDLLIVVFIALLFLVFVIKQYNRWILRKNKK